MNCLEHPQKKIVPDYAKIIKNEYFEPSSQTNFCFNFCIILRLIIRAKLYQFIRYRTICHNCSQILRGRFYHGYSYYELGQNSLGYLFAPLIKKDLSAIVIPNDIFKHPMAACSQQSIVGMEVFKTKGIKVRKIGFFADGYGGHFLFEALFGGKCIFLIPISNRNYLLWFRIIFRLYLN